MSAGSDVITTDGLRLAVQEHGDRKRPTIVAVHGYPDDHTVWDGLVPLLAERFHVVTYDVRGAGDSDAPASRSGYQIPQLVADLGSVLDATAPGERVHLLAHDWGSVQTWPAVTDPAFADRLAGFTSISGPDLAMIGAWMRGVREHPVATLRQALSSSYILGFQLPFVPEKLIDTGVLGKLTGRRLDARTARNGLELYRANMLTRTGLPLRGTDLPVQILAPTDDPYVSARFQLDVAAPRCTDLRTHRVPGGHWVVAEDPGLVAGLVTRFVDTVDTE